MPSIGWIALGERPGSELTFGQVSKVRKGRANPPDEPVTPATFLGFDQPGFAKVVESTRVDPYGERASIVTANHASFAPMTTADGASGGTGSL